MSNFGWIINLVKNIRPILEVELLLLFGTSFSISEFFPLYIFYYYSPEFNNVNFLNIAVLLTIMNIKYLISEFLMKMLVQMKR